MLEYTHPITGGHVTPTMSARIQLLRPGESTRPHRHTGAVRYQVVSGQGVTTVEQKALEWDDHDQFTIPSWRWHEHRNPSRTEPAILFSITDSPVAEHIGMYKEEKG